MPEFRMTKFRRRVRPVAVGVIAAATVGLASSTPVYAVSRVNAARTASVDSPPGGVQVTADGWVHYTSVLGMVGGTGTTSKFKGVRDDSGSCSISGSDAETASISGLKYTEEVAYNPSTCESTVVTGKITAAQLSKIATLTGDPNAANIAATAPAAASATVSGSNQVAAASTVYSRYLRTSWIDPINITISSQKAGAQWTSAALQKWAVTRSSYKGCIGSVCLDKTYIVSNSQSAASVTGGWKVAGNVHFRNTSFALWVVAAEGPAGWAACGFPTSNQADFHHTDYVTGLKAGGSNWSWNDTKSGACTNLVHHGSATDSTYPF